MKVELFQTVGKKDSCQKTVVKEFQKDSGEENQVINLYPQVRDQRWDGVGGAITDAAGSVFSMLNEGQKNELLSFYFAPDQMNYQNVRIPLDSCDFSTQIYEAVPKKDETLSSFSFEGTMQYILPLLEEAQKRAKGKLKLMLSPWSPPAWMKTNGSRLKGGSLKPEYYGLWAKYLCRYIREFTERGFQVERLSIQNEPKAVQTWDSCIYTAEEEKIFLRDYLYPQMQKEDFGDVELFIWDHNKERLFDRVSQVLDDSTEDKVTGAAFHWYSGDHFEALDLVRKCYPDKKLILSESCLEYNKFDKGKECENAARLAHDMIGNLNHGMCAFYDWNLLLNVSGGPNHVQNFCDAPFLFDPEEKKLIQRRSAQYYWHFAHFIKPGARRIGHSCYSGRLELTAWQNEDGEIVFVLLNAGDKDMDCVLRLEGQEVRFVVDGNAIMSGRISKKEVERYDS